MMRGMSHTIGAAAFFTLAVVCHVTLAAAMMTSSATWKSPCGDARHAPSHSIAASLSRWHGGGNMRPSPHQLQSLLFDVSTQMDGTIAMLHEMKTFIRQYFRGNTHHIMRLETFPPLTELLPPYSISEAASIEDVLGHLYELFTRIAIFTRYMKGVLASSRGSHETMLRLRQLHVLEQGGTWQGLTLHKGLYSTLCDIHRTLPLVLDHLDRSIIPSTLSASPASSATHHNQDYYILHNMEQALRRVKDSLRVFIAGS